MRAHAAPNYARARRATDSPVWPQTAWMHVSIFLGMTFILLVLVLWFIGELQRAMAEEKLQESKKKE